MMRLSFLVLLLVALAVWCCWVFLLQSPLAEELAAEQARGPGQRSSHSSAIGGAWHAASSLGIAPEAAAGLESGDAGFVDVYSARLTAALALLDVTESSLTLHYPPKSWSPPGLMHFTESEAFKQGLQDETGKGLCVVSIVDEAYADFAVPFVYSLILSHPDSKALIFSMGETSWWWPWWDSPTSWESATRTLTDELDVARDRFSFIDMPEWRRVPRSLSGSSVTAMLRFTNLREHLLHHDCTFTYIADSDIYFFKSPSTANKTILKWHLERVQETQRPFDNLERAEKDAFGCISDSGRRLTGLHFAVTRPWYDFVGPCLERIINGLIEEPALVRTYCSATSVGHFLDEHVLWMGARLCGVYPGADNPSFNMTRLSVPRPVHGLHVHNHDVEPVDRHAWCSTIQRVLPYLEGLARHRYELANANAGCEPV